ncbi:hypothetical protein PUN4_600091 [Paraburkholderia unamae]|nr:hypothetical protein PUN4_600091 [Paraburkholderia unamae]
MIPIEMVVSIDYTKIAAGKWDGACGPARVRAWGGPKEHSRSGQQSGASARRNKGWNQRPWWAALRPDFATESD